MPTAILIHSYCMAKDLPFRLTAMTEESVFTAIRLMQERQAECIFLSSAYDSWVQEARLKATLLIKNGVKINQLESVAPINNTFDEIEKTRVLVDKLGITHIIVVAEEWHAPRAEMIARRAFPKLEISLVPFNTPCFERAHEPHPIKLLGWIKSIRAAYKPLWIAWNICMLLLTPLLLWQKRVK